MVRALRTVLCAASYENFTVICLNRAKTDRDREILQKLFTALPIVIHIVVGNYFLIEFEEVDFVVLETMLSCENFILKIVVG